METRVTSMKGLVEDYYEQLNGFDSGLATQVGVILINILKDPVNLKTY